MRSSSSSPRRGLVVFAASIAYLCWQPDGPGRVQGRGRGSSRRAIDREYYLHFSGQKDDFEIEAIYERHAGLFSREAVERLRESGNAAAARVRRQGADRPGDQGGHRRARAARGGARDRGRRRDDALPRGGRAPGATSPTRSGGGDRGGAQRRHRHRAQPAAAGAARAGPRARARARLAAATWRCAEELSGIDLGALGAPDRRVPRGQRAAPTSRCVEPELERQLGFGFDRLRRADLPAFFRAPELDAAFPAERLVPSLGETLAGLGIDVAAQPGVVLDTEARPKKSPRAFCAPVRVPDEVYLVIAPHRRPRRLRGAVPRGRPHRALRPRRPRAAGRGALLRRQLGHRGVRVPVRAPGVRARSGCAASGGRRHRRRSPRHARASKLLFLRRYCAKLRYELELHDAGADLDAMPARYSELLGGAAAASTGRRPPGSATSTRSSTPPATCGRGRSRRSCAARLRERFGEAWFESPRRASTCARSGAAARARPPRSCSAAPLDFSVLLADLARSPAPRTASPRPR